MRGTDPDAPHPVNKAATLTRQVRCAFGSTLLLSTERCTEKKSSSTSSTLGGKIARRRMKSLRTWSAARRTGAVDATTFGRTFVLPLTPPNRPDSVVTAFTPTPRRDPELVLTCES